MIIGSVQTEMCGEQIFSEEFSSCLFCDFLPSLTLNTFPASMIQLPASMMDNGKLKRRVSQLPRHLSWDAHAHYPMQSSARRCMQCAPVEKRTQLVCAECKIPLCSNRHRKCFVEFHNELFLLNRKPGVFNDVILWIIEHFKFNTLKKYLNYGLNS